MNVFELFGTIAINNRDANSALDDTTTRAERSGSRIQAAFKNIGGAALKIGKGVGAAVMAVGAAVVSGVESTRDYRTEMAKLTTAFATNGFSAESAKFAYKRLQAVLGETDDAVEAAQLLSSICGDTEDLSKWLDICTGVYGKFGSGIPLTELAASAVETARTGVVTGNLADALVFAGISEDDFNKKLAACTSDAERQDLIMNTLYWTYKAAADQYKETGASVMAANTAQDNLTEAFSNFWGVCEPVVTAAKEIIADWVTASTPYIATLVNSIMNFGDTWRNEIWPIIQKEVKCNFLIDLPDWDTTKEKIVSGWGKIETAVSELFILEFIVNLPSQWNDIGISITEGWLKDVYPMIKDYFKVTFGIDMPNWSDVATSILTGWNYVLNRIYRFLRLPISSEYITGINYTDKPREFGGGRSSGNGGGRSFDTPDGSHASGLDSVPHDGYLARLHKKEAVLNERDADIWRGGGSGRVEALLSELVGIMRAGQVIQLDSGIMAGQLTPAIDARLGTVARYKGRGN